MYRMKFVGYVCVRRDSRLLFDNHACVHVLGRVSRPLTGIWRCVSMMMLQVIEQELGECGPDC
jgi:hypothetical protein